MSSVNWEKPDTLLDPLRDAIKEHRRYDIPRPMKIDMSQFAQVVDGMHVTKLDNFDWELSLHYHIDVYGVPKKRVDDGVCHEVTILRAFIVNDAAKFEQEINLKLLGKDIVDLQTEIGLKLDEEQSNE